MLVKLLLVLCLLINQSLAAHQSWLDSLHQSINHVTEPIWQAVVDRCAYNPDAIASVNQAISHSIIGQPFATDIVVRLLSSHIQSINQSLNQKPLVLSFHGLTGTGKTLLRKLIGDHLFVGGDVSKHVHHFHGGDFSDDRPKEANQLKLYLRGELLSILRHCPLSLIVFEEMHQMNPVILNELQHFFRDFSSIDGVDVTSATYILTSNTGGGAIQGYAFEAEKQGITRDAIDYSKISHAITSALTQQQLLVKLIDNGLVDAYVPFFPLFKSHVKECFDHQLREKARLMVEHKQVHSLTWDDDVLSFGASLLDYTGPVSSQGCRPVAPKIVSDILADMERAQTVGEIEWWGRRRYGLANSDVRLVVQERQMSAKERGRAADNKTTQPIAAKQYVKAVITKAIKKQDDLSLLTYNNANNACNL